MSEAVQLGARLRAARERRGLSQHAAAQALGLPRTAVTNIESGNRAVSTLELTKLADLYGRPPTHFLREGDAESLDPAVVLLRAEPGIGHNAEIDSAIRHCLDLCLEGAALRKLLGHTIEQTVPNYAARLTSVGDAIRQGEIVAQEERRRLGLGNAPLGNPAEIISGQGIWVCATVLPEDLSGIFLNYPSIGLAVLINSKHSAVRRRFSYAHEYAHALFDKEQGITRTRRDNASDLDEKRANAFAAAFLMPADGIADQLLRLDKGHRSRQAQMIFDVANNGLLEAEIRPPAGSQSITYQDVALIALYFGVSYEAAVWRLKSVDRLNSAETNILIQQKDFGRRYTRMLGFLDPQEKLPPEGIEAPDQELRGQLARLVIEAYRREEISRGRLLELSTKLGFPGSDLMDLAEAARAD